MQRGEGAGLKLRWERRRGTFAVGLKTDLERLSVSKKNAKEEKAVLLIWGGQQLWLVAKAIVVASQVLIVRPFTDV